MDNQQPLDPMVATLGGICILLVCVYYFCAQHQIAKKLGDPNPWLAFIPVGNALQQVRLARKPFWWIFLIGLPWIGVVFFLIIWLKITERLGKPLWVGILAGLPLINVIVIGYLGFSAGQPRESSQYDSRIL